MTRVTTDTTTVLMIHPGGLFPVQGGGASRTWAEIAYLRQNGYKVTLVTANHGAYNPELAARVDTLCVQEGNGAPAPHKRAEKTFAKRLRGALKRRWRRLLDLGQSQPAGTVSWLQRSRRKGIERLAGAAAYANPPAAAIAIYANMAPALDHMPPGVLRILDTIDVQYKRTQQACAAGGNLSDRVCSREEEIRELLRADVLLAIQEEEQAELRAMCPERPVLLVRHAVEIPEFEASAADSREVLFVGNLYDPNVRGIRAFLAEVWPLVLRSEPRARLVLCGRVCDAIRRAPAGVVLEGVVPDLRPYYRRAAVVVNPVPYGTGLKIKSVEALAHGRCLVCSTAGTLGLGEPATLPLVIADAPRLMAENVLRALREPGYRAAIEQRAYAYAGEHFGPDATYRELLNCLKNRA